MTLPAKVELLSEEALDKDLEIIANAIVQVYKNINNYRNNEYPNYKYNKDKTVFPLVVTLEEWYFLVDTELDKINKSVKEQFNNVNLPVSWLYTREFEQMMQIIQNVGIQKFMDKKWLKSEESTRDIAAYMSNYFPEERKKAKFLFEDDFDEIFPPGL
ncbi:MAG: hypothetical protein ACYSTI_04405 [Planctomycetota bacterium]|jgi:hypothetical protein